MSLIKELTAKYKVIPSPEMGVKVEGNYIRKDDLENVIGGLTYLKGKDLKKQWESLILSLGDFHEVLVKINPTLASHFIKWVNQLEIIEKEIKDIAYTD